MKITIGTTVKTTLVTSALALSTGSYAASWVNDDGTLEPGKTIQAINANSNKNSYTGNPALVHRAWGMQGSWLSFEVTEAADVFVSLSSASTNAPGFTVYRTDGVFTGQSNGTSNKDGIEGAIHAFNQVAQAGDPGLVWATDDSVADSIEGNTTENGIVETLGYVNGSGKDYVNYWGYQVAAGAHDLSIDNQYESGVFGSVDRDSGPNGDTNYANLTLVNLQPGHYTIFLGGTNTDGVDTPIDVKVSALPLSTADCLMNYQELNNPEQYPHAGLVSMTLNEYYYRHYEETGAYLGVSSTDNHLYSLSAQEGALVDLGDTVELKQEAGCN